MTMNREPRVGSDHISPEASVGPVKAPQIDQRRRGWLQKLEREAKRQLWIFLYLLAMFGLFMLHEATVLARYNIGVTRFGFALANAWIFAKVLQIMENLHFGRRLERGPLAYSVVYKSILFAVSFMVVYVAEEVVVGLIRGKTLLQSIPAIGGGSLQGVASVGLILAFALAPYFAFVEVGRVVGRRELYELFFTRRAK